MKRQPLRKLFLLVSFLLFPITLFYFSPYLIIQGGIAGIITGSFCVFLALFLFSFFLGRAFCGWICPAGGLQEMCFPINSKPIRNHKINFVKYIIWFPWIIGIIAAFIPAGGFRKIDFFYMTDHGISASSIPGFIMYFAIIFLITMLALTLGRRGMCHSICWMAPFMILGTKISKKINIPSLHLKADSKKCINCQQCRKQCPMSLDVPTMVLQNNMTNSECILCGECSDICSKKAIHFAFSNKSSKDE